MADGILSIGADVRPMVRDVSKAFSQLQSKIRSQGLNIDVSRSSRGLRELTGQSDRLQRSLARSSEVFLSIASVTSTIFAIQRGFKSLVNTTKEVEFQFTQIQSILKASSSNFQQFQKDIFNVSRDVGVSFKETAEVANEFARQGLSLNDTLTRTSDALKLVRLSGLSTTEAVSSLTAIVNTFKDEALDSSTAVEKLANTAAAFAVSERDFSLALQRAGASASGAGASFDEMLGLISALQERTARGGAVIGNGLKSIFVRVQKTDTLDQLESLGISVRDLEGNTKPAIEILSQLAKVFDQLSDSAQAETIQNVAGIYQANTLQALLKDLGSEYSIFAQATQKASEESSQATVRIEQFNRTLNDLFIDTQTNVQEFSSNLGSIAVEPAIRKVLGFVNKTLTAFNEFSDGKLGKIILGGLAEAISGPGLILIAGTLGKLAVAVGTQFKSAIADLSALGGWGNKYYLTQKQINVALQSQKREHVELLSAAKTEEAQAKALLKITRDITRELEKQALVMAKTTSNVNRVAAGKPIVKTSARAEGFLPLMSAIKEEDAMIKRGVGGASRSAKPVVIDNFNTGRGRETVVANTDEYIVKNFNGSGASAILNKDMLDRLGGVNKTSAKAITAATGYPTLRSGATFDRVNNKLVINKGGKKLPFEKESAKTAANLKEVNQQLRTLKTEKEKELKQLKKGGPISESVRRKTEKELDKVNSKLKLYQTLPAAIRKTTGLDERKTALESKLKGVDVNKIAKTQNDLAKIKSDLSVTTRALASKNLTRLNQQRSREKRFPALKSGTPEFAARQEEKLYRLFKLEAQEEKKRLQERARVESIRDKARADAGVVPTQKGKEPLTKERALQEERRKLQEKQIRSEVKATLQKEENLKKQRALDYANLQRQGKIQLARLDRRDREIARFGSAARPFLVRGVTELPPTPQEKQQYSALLQQRKQERRDKSDYRNFRKKEEESRRLASIRAQVKADLTPPPLVLTPQDKANKIYQQRQLQAQKLAEARLVDKEVRKLLARDNMIAKRGGMSQLDFRQRIADVQAQRQQNQLARDASRPARQAAAQRREILQQRSIARGQFMERAAMPAMFASFAVPMLAQSLKGSNERTNAQITASATGLSTFLSVFSLFPNKVGLAIGALGGLGLAINGFIKSARAVGDSVEKITEQSEERINKTNELNVAVRAYDSALAQLQDAIKSGAKPREIDRFQNAVNESFANIPDPAIRQKIFEVSNSPERSDEFSKIIDPILKESSKQTALDNFRRSLRIFQDEGGDFDRFTISELPEELARELTRAAGIKTSPDESFRNAQDFLNGNSTAEKFLEQLGIKEVSKDLSDWSKLLKTEGIDAILRNVASQQQLNAVLQKKIATEQQLQDIQVVTRDNLKLLSQSFEVQRGLSEGRASRSFEAMSSFRRNRFDSTLGNSDVARAFFDNSIARSEAIEQTRSELQTLIGDATSEIFNTKIGEKLSSEQSNLLASDLANVYSAIGSNDIFALIDSIKELDANASADNAKIFAGIIESGEKLQNSLAILEDSLTTTLSKINKENAASLFGGFSGRPSFESGSNLFKIQSEGVRLNLRKAKTKEEKQSLAEDRRDFSLNLASGITSDFSERLGSGLIKEDIERRGASILAEAQRSALTGDLTKNNIGEFEKRIRELPTDDINKIARARQFELEGDISKTLKGDFDSFVNSLDPSVVSNASVRKQIEQINKQLSTTGSADFRGLSSTLGRFGSKGGTDQLLNQFRSRVQQLGSVRGRIRSSQDGDDISDIAQAQVNKELPIDQMLRSLNDLLYNSKETSTLTSIEKHTLDSASRLLQVGSVMNVIKGQFETGLSDIAKIREIMLKNETEVKNQKILANQNQLGLTQTKAQQIESALSETKTVAIPAGIGSPGVTTKVKAISGKEREKLSQELETLRREEVRIKNELNRLSPSSTSVTPRNSSGSQVPNVIPQNTPSISRNAQTQPSGISIDVNINPGAPIEIRVGQDGEVNTEIQNVVSVAVEESVSRFKSEIAENIQRKIDTFAQKNNLRPSVS